MFGRDPSFDPQTDLLFQRGKPLPLHPNGMRFSAFNEPGAMLAERIYYSVGGGFVLSGEGKRQLLACKHGSAYRIGSAAVDEFASEIRLRGTQGGILVTEGMLDKDGLEKAGRHHIEIIDGPRLWPTVKPMVEGKLQRRIVGNASARARRRNGLI